MISYGFGHRMTSVVVSDGSAFDPGGSFTEYLCMNDTKNIKNSTLAKLSPRQFLLAVKIHGSKSLIYAPY